jgi:glycosyltransferase involved in cell wall biosynthesis
MQDVRALPALIVAYAFPPVGGAGVQRVVKLAKYLPAHGVRPAVLTVSNPSVPVLDPSLEKDVPRGMDIERVPTFEPGYDVKQQAWKGRAASNGSSLRSRAMHQLSRFAKQLLTPDPQILWQPAAQVALANRLRDRKDGVVFISGPPFSQFLLAPLARMRGKVGVVLDYRDEWSTLRTSYEMMASKAGHYVGDPLERAVLRAAHIVTTATEEFRVNLLARFRFLDPSRVRAIPNGYDSDDFPHELPKPPRDRFVVTYAGSVFKLTSARGFLRAVKKLHAREPELAKLLRVRFLGRIVDTELDAFEGTEALGVERRGYVPHDEVVRALAASHMVLCILDDVEGVERIYPAKIFELMYLGRPTLTLSPAGALARLVATHNLGDLLPPRDEDAICALLVERLRDFARGDADARRGVPVGIERYHRRALAGEFAEAMRDARRLAGG